MKRLFLTIALFTVLVPGLARAEDTTIYAVIYNHEWIYSMWQADRDLPPGWESADFIGTKEECVAFIQRVNTDGRPRGLRQRMMDGGLGADPCLVANLPPHKCAR